MRSNQIVASNLIKVRKENLKWSQEKAAEQLGIKRSTLASYEEGRALPSVILLVKIADTYGIVNWKGFVTDSEFDYKQQIVPLSAPSLIEQRYHELNEKEKSLAKTLLNLP